MKFNILVALFLFILNESFYSQTNKQDSIEIASLISKAQLASRSSFDSAVIYSEQAIKLSKNSKWKKGEVLAEKSYAALLMNYGEDSLANLHLEICIGVCNELIKSKSKSNSNFGKSYKGRCLLNQGSIYTRQGEHKKAIQYSMSGLKYAEEAKDTFVTIAALNMIGAAYRYQADYPSAMKYFYKSLKIAEETNNKSQCAASYNSIAAVFYYQKDFEKAKDYYLKGIKIAEEIGDNNFLGKAYANLGSLYSEINENEEALKYYEVAYKINKDQGNQEIVGGITNSLGNLYLNKRDYTKALKYYLESEEILESINSKQTLLYTLSNIGNVKRMMHKNTEAELYLDKAFILSKELGDIKMQEVIENYYYQLFEEKGDFRKAHDHYKNLIVLRDSIFNEEKTKEIMRTEMDHEFEKKKALSEAEHKSTLEKQKLVAEEKQRRQNIIIWSVVLGLILVVVFAIYVLKLLRTTNKQKHIIEEKSKETEEQKNIIEEKHKEITDSINYAERIQRSFLASKEVLDASLEDYFVYFQPKDVVSGDFYWATKLRNDQFALVTADSTGHGVPGAIMSLLNITSLEKAIEQNNQPSAILNATRRTIIERLKKDGSERGGKDGMDASLISFDFVNNKFTYAAANNPIWVVRNNELIELKPDKMPIGKHDKDFEPFTEHQFLTQAGDVVYALTDGMPDQFGGPKGKKFMYKQLKELLVSIAHEPMQNQKQILKDAFNAWKGNLEQVDDVCLIGVRT